MSAGAASRRAPDPARFRVPRDVWIGAGALGLALLYGAGARGIPVSPLDGVVTARALPELLAAALALFSLLLIVRALLLERVRLRAARAAPPGADAPPEAGAAPAPAWRRHLKAAGVLGIGVAYLWLLPRLGYLPSMILLVGAMALYIGAPRTLRTAGVAVGVSVAFWLLFDRLLGIPMPDGVLGGLLG